MWRAGACVYGHARATEDIDVLVPESALQTVFDVVATTGFVIETGWLEFKAGTPSELKLFRLLKPIPEAPLVLDMFVVTPVIKPVWDDRQVVQRDKRKLTVVSADGLIRMKRLTGRQRDLSDIERLEGTGDADE